MKYNESYIPTGKTIKNIDVQTMYKYTVGDFEKY